MLLAQISSEAVGGAGPAIFAVLSVAGLAIFGSYSFVYFSHCFFAIAEATSAGQDEIAWPNEPMMDRLSKAVWMAWMLLLTAAPTYIFGSAIAGPRAAGWFIAATGMVFLFPIIALSLQTGQSPGSIFHPEAVRRIMRRPDHLLGYFASVAVAYLIVGVGAMLMFGYSRGLLPIGALLVTVGLFIAARLYGRLTHLVSRVKVREKRKAAPPRPTRLDEAAQIAANRASRTTSGSEGAYGMRSATGEPAGEFERPSIKRLWVEEGADDPYAFAAGEPATLPNQQLPAALLNPSDYEMALAIGNRPVKPPDHPWIQGTFTFPFRPSGWQSIVCLAAGLTVSGFLLRVLIG